MLQCSMRRSTCRRSFQTLTCFPTMTIVFLALVPILFATGSLVWLMTSGAKAQARSDAWAAKWVRDNT